MPPQVYALGNFGRAAMSHSLMPKEQQTKLEQAAALLSAVQVEMASRRRADVRAGVSGEEEL